MAARTLVTVESAVLYVLKPEDAQRSVIWVAQTDELCEQAVQAFRQVWLNLGAKGTDLRIVRLWGGNPNPAIQKPDKPVVMVASIQTLNSRMGAEGLAGLRNPGLVVVDECHHAITPSYTNLFAVPRRRKLQDQGRRRKTNRPFSDSAPLHSGLTMKKVEDWPADSTADGCLQIRKTCIVVFVIKVSWLKWIMRH